MKDRQIYNGWDITMGDYVRHADDYTAIHKKILKREKIVTHVLIILGSLFMLIFFIIALIVVSKV